MKVVEEWRQVCSCGDQHVLSQNQEFIESRQVPQTLHNTLSYALHDETITLKPWL